MTNKVSAHRPPGQDALMQAGRLVGNKKMGEIIKNASIDDLEWFLQMTELQIEETPYWVEDQNRLHHLQAWHRHCRTMVTSELHNKRVHARPRAMWRRFVRDAILLVLGAVAAMAIPWAIRTLF